MGPADILQTRINGILGCIFVGAFALGASLLIWHAASGKNPVADALTPLVTPASLEQ